MRHVDDELFERSTITSIIFEEGSTLESIGDRAFADTKFTGELTFPQGLVSVGEAAFKNCDQFTLAGDLPATLESVGKEAFYGCIGLTGPLALPASLESVGDEVSLKRVRNHCSSATILILRAVGSSRLRPVTVLSR